MMLKQTDRIKQLALTTNTQCLLMVNLFNSIETIKLLIKEKSQIGWFTFCSSDKTTMSV
jgi:hypothetical protein